MLQRVGLLVLALALSTSFGCQLNRRAKWYPPVLASPGKARGKSVRSKVEALYARALEREADRDARCVDDFFQAAALAWPDVERKSLKYGAPRGRSGEIYRSCLIKLVTTGRHFGRFDPKRGLDVRTSDGRITIPAHYYGFLRQPTDFDHLIPVGDYKAKDLKSTYRYDGVGIATIVIHHRRPQERFRRKQQTFGATIVLRPRHDTGFESFALEMYDPQRYTEISTPEATIALKRDLSAPTAFVLSRADRQNLSGFLQPGSSTSNEGLFMVTPFQPGKIPVVFVHGLLSDPYTWANIANELYARPEVVERFQIWGYEYPTGEPFLVSAATLRRQLLEVQARYDPAWSDTSLSRIVLIGHSMGGLVSKLQVTHSQNRLWDSVSCKPFQGILAAPETRNILADAFFFKPSPMVSRVVFVGTPHRGSPWARRSIGQIASKLVRGPEDGTARHAQLVRENPATFSTEFSERIPTSIDLLESTSPLLQAIDQLPRDGRVQLHTILGEGYLLLGGGNSDGVVPVTSARQSGAVTERMIHAKHRQLHQSPEGIEEILCILQKHVQEYDSELINRERHGMSWANESLIFRRKAAGVGKPSEDPRLLGIDHATTQPIAEISDPQTQSL
jgi:pimeloyl-ACP methyl ester carboxylesterase